MIVVHVTASFFQYTFKVVDVVLLKRSDTVDLQRYRRTQFQSAWIWAGGKFKRFCGACPWPWTVHERWHDGIWFGLQFTAAEHIVALTDGRVVRARSVHPNPDSTRPTKAALIHIQTGPWGATGVITQDPHAVPPSGDGSSVGAPRLRTRWPADYESPEN